MIINRFCLIPAASLYSSPSLSHFLSTWTSYHFTEIAGVVRVLPVSFIHLASYWCFCVHVFLACLVGFMLLTFVTTGMHKALFSTILIIKDNLSFPGPMYSCTVLLHRPIILLEICSIFTILSKTVTQM